MYHFPKTVLSRQQLVEALTVKSKLNDYGQKVVYCFKETANEFQVPVAWAKHYTTLPFGKLNDRKPTIKISWPVRKGDYINNQAEVVAASIEHVKQFYSGYVQADTGFGKSYAALDIARQLETNVLILCHKTDVLRQFELTAKDYFQVDCGYIMGKKRNDLTNPVILSTMQTFVKRIEADPTIADKFGLMILDEMHRTGCDTYVKIMQKTNCRYCIGMTATLRRADLLHPVWENYLGKLIIRGKKTKETKRLVYTPIVDCSRINFGDFMDWQGKINHTQGLTALATNTDYNNWIVETIETLLAKNRRPIFTTKRKEQIEILERMLKLKGIETGIYVGGSHNGKTLKQNDLIEALKRPVLLATDTKVGEGMDVKNMLGEDFDVKYAFDTIIIGSLCKDSEQQIGRIRDYEGLRNIPLIIHPTVNIDYCRNFVNTCKKKYYKNFDFIAGLSEV